MMRKPKIIETIALCFIAVAVVTTVLCVILVSYFSWKAYFKAASTPTDPSDRPAKTVLQSIDAELAEGKQYYDNGLAIVKSDDFVVTAHYLTGEEKSEEVLEPNKYEVSAPDNFAAFGGTVTVRYKGKEAKLEISLVAVEFDRLEIKQNPYTVKYKTGSVFNPIGMIVYAVYNDGSEKELSAEDYYTDTTTKLVLGQTQQLVSYTVGSITKSVNVAITVSDDFDNGKVVSISAAGECYAEPGENITSLVPSVVCTYESGNSEITTDITIANSPETVVLGKQYTLNVEYNDDRKLSATVPVVVRMHVEGEDTTIVGGTRGQQESYSFDKVDGEAKFVLTGEEPKFAGSFALALKNGEDAYISFTVNSLTSCVADITLNCGNSYLVVEDDNFWMRPLQINTIMDMTINGNAMEIADDVVLAGCGPIPTDSQDYSPNYAPLYNVYYQFVFTDIGLEPGDNVIKLAFKESTEGARTIWGESPSTMNIDWINVDVKGSVIDENADIVGLDIGYIDAQYGDVAQDIMDKINVIGVMSNGTRMLIDRDLVDIALTNGNDGLDEGRLGLGDFTFTATLKSDPSITADHVITIDYRYIKVSGCRLYKADDRIYYEFEFDCIGYDPEDFKFFGDGGYSPSFTYTQGFKTLVITIDVTDIDVNDLKQEGDEYRLYPHLLISKEYDVKYDNGANGGGDILLTSFESTTFTQGGKKYELKLHWSMPTLVVTPIE